jgi:hypothetical protein
LNGFSVLAEAWNGTPLDETIAAAKAHFYLPHLECIRLQFAAARELKTHNDRNRTYRAFASCVCNKKRTKRIAPLGPLTNREKGANPG